MIKRTLQAGLEASLRKYPVVGIVGSRQTGKTTLAKLVRQTVSSKSVYLDLELPSDLNKLQSPELYRRQFSDRLVIIDEIQRMPELFPLMRALVDQKRSGGRFLILGSVKFWGTLIRDVQSTYPSPIFHPFIEKGTAATITALAMTAMMQCPPILVILPTHRHDGQNQSYRKLLLFYD